MAIVDFAQDAAAQFGTGNFRDDQGRVMYLHDPETAARFTKTLPGAPAPGSARPPDQRVASLQQPDTSSQMGAPQTPGQALVDQLDQSKAVVDAPPGGAPAGGAPGPTNEAPPVAPNVAPPAANATPAAPNIAAPAPNAAPPVAGQGPGAALANSVASFDASIAARKTPQSVELPKPNPSGNVPLYGVHSGDEVSVEEGRPAANVLEQLHEEESFGTKQDNQIRAAYAEKAKGKQIEIGGQVAAANLGYFSEGDKRFNASREYREAIAEQKRLQQAIDANDKAMDPERYVNQMSTGKRVAMIFLAALNGGFGAVIGQKSNGVIDALNRAIDADIDAQKMQIGNRKTSLGNQLQRFITQGFDAKQAELLARDKQAANIVAYAQLEAQRANAPAEFKAAAEALIAPLQQARVQRKGELLASMEAKVKRTRQEGITHQIPPPGPFATPQGELAALGVKKEKIEQANAETVGNLIGHAVSPEEAARLKQDAQEYGDKNQVNQDAIDKIARLATYLGLKKGKGGWEGNADPGVRPLGISMTDRSVQTDRLWNDVVQAQVQRSKREPAARIQDAQGNAVARPFNDNQIPALLNDVEAVARNSQAGLRQGYGEAAMLYDRTIAEEDRAQRAAAAAPAARAKPGKPATPAERAAAERERAKTRDMMNQAPGDPREE